MQCGCECTECTITDSAGNKTPSTDSTVCNSLNLQSADAPEVTCIARNESNCGAEFSEPDEVEFCAITSPSLWAPLYDLSNALDLALFRESDDSSSDSGAVSARNSAICGAVG